MPRERNAFFITVNFVSIIDAFKLQAKEWMDKHGHVLRTLGDKELTVIREEMDMYK